MGRIWRSRPRKTLLGLTLLWILQSVTPEPTSAKVVNNFYDPKYHDDGRDETKIVEYKPVESSNVFTVQPSLSNQEFHDINPGGMGIYSGTGPVRAEAEKIRGQVVSNSDGGISGHGGWTSGSGDDAPVLESGAYSSGSGGYLSGSGPSPWENPSFTKAQSYFKDEYPKQRPIGVFEVHNLENEDFSSTSSGKVTWPNYPANDDKNSISLTQAPPTVSSYNSFPVFNADPIYDHKSFSKYPLSEYPPSSLVPVHPEEVKGLVHEIHDGYKSYKSDPYSSSGFNIVKAHSNDFKPTVLKEAVQGNFVAEFHDQVPRDPYNYQPGPPPAQSQYQGPLSAFYQSAPEAPKPSQRPPFYSSISNALKTEYTKVANGLSAFYQQNLKPQERPPVSPTYSEGPPPGGPEYSDQIANGPYIPQGPKTPDAGNFESPVYGVPGQGIYQQFTSPLKSLSSLNPWSSISSYFSLRPPNSDPDSYKHQPLSSTYTNGPAGTNNGPEQSAFSYGGFDDLESYRPGRPVLSSQSDYKGFSEFPEFGGGGPKKVKSTSYTVTRPPIFFGDGRPTKAFLSSKPRPLSSFYESSGPAGKLPGFGDGVTVTHSAYPPTELDGFDPEDFALFEKPAFKKPSESFDDFFDDNLENYGTKNPSSGSNGYSPGPGPGYPYGQLEDDDMTGWSPTPFSLSSLFSSSKRPQSHPGQFLSPGYSPGGWSTYGSYKPPEEDVNHPASYFSKGKNRIKYGTPYDLIQSPNYGNYYKNKFGGWERSPSSSFGASSSGSSGGLKGYRYRYTTLHHPGSNPLHLPSQYDMENNPPEPESNYNYDCENRHSCSGQQPSLGISGSVDLTRRPKPKRFRNSFFKRLIRRLAGKRKRRRPRPGQRGRPCRGRRC